jgi:hypothetical protein
VSDFFKLILVAIAFFVMLALSRCQTAPSRVQPIMAHYTTAELCEKDFGGAAFCSADHCSSIELIEGGNAVCSPRFYWSDEKKQFIAIKQDSSRYRLSSLSQAGPVNAAYITEEGRMVLDE